MSFFADLESQIATAMQADRHRLRNLLRAVQRAEDEGRPPDQQLQKLLTQVEESNRRREARQAIVPKLVYDDALPIVARREEIAAAIREHRWSSCAARLAAANRRSSPKSAWKSAAELPA